MKKLTLLLFTITMAAPLNNLFAGDLSAVQILKKLDNVINAPKDQTLKQKIVLIDKNGKRKNRIIIMKQKGFNKRIAKFISPADQRGIAFLSLPNDVIYLYLPAFKKVRRIATHVKNSKFAGMDATYEDMEAKRYTDKWNPKLLKTDSKHYTLQIKPKRRSDSSYSKIILTVRKDNFFPVKSRFYNRRGKYIKVMTVSSVKKIGNYWTAGNVYMKDLKTKHATQTILLKAKYDRGLSSRQFTKRYLKR